MAEVKEVERRRLFKKHLEQSMDIDKYHWRKQTDELLQDLPTAPNASDSTVAGPSLTLEACSDEKEAARVPSNVREDLARPGSPGTSVSSTNDEISDEELLPLPSRSHRSEARHHVSAEAEERRSQMEARVSRVRTRSRTSRLNPQADGPASPMAEQPCDPSLTVWTRTPRAPSNNRHAGFSDRGRTHEQGPSDSSPMIDDELSPWPPIPIPSEASSRVRVVERASVSRLGGALPSGLLLRDADIAKNNSVS